MFQKWSDLLFCHFRVNPDWIQALLPTGLTVDTYQGDAYIGHVAFRMEEVRPARLPSVPYLSYFPETNVRTYVLGPDGTPGVWFFSLDTPRWPANFIARKLFSLPYYQANLTQRILESSDRRGLHVTGRRSTPARFMNNFTLPRVWPGVEGIITSGDYELEIDLSSETPERAKSGTLEDFLVERYVLYSVDPAGVLFRGEVWHLPYELTYLDPSFVSGTCQAVTEIEGFIGARNSLPIENKGDFDHVCYSPGVKVEVFPLARATGLSVG